MNSINLKGCITELISDLEEYFMAGEKTMENFLPEFKAFKFTDPLPEIPFSQKQYTRNRIYRCDQFEILFIGWDEGNSTKVHDHAENGCLLKMMYGQIRETRFGKDGNKVSLFNSGDSAYIHNTLGTHKLENVHPGKSLSLHIYSPPDYLSRYTTDGNDAS